MVMTNKKEWGVFMMGVGTLAAPLAPPTQNNRNTCRNTCRNTLHQHHTQHHTHKNTLLPSSYLDTLCEAHISSNGHKREKCNNKKQQGGTCIHVLPTHVKVEENQSPVGVNVFFFVCVECCLQVCMCNVVCAAMCM